MTVLGYFAVTAAPLWARAVSAGALVVVAFSAGITAGRAQLAAEQLAEAQSLAAEMERTAPLN